MAGTTRFERIRDQLEKLFAETGEPVARRATAAALLHHKIASVSWTGFYLLHDGELIVDVYQGPVACLRLQAHTGVCWAAIDRGEPLIVPDVHAFPGHIPCDTRTRSELVVPLHHPDGTPAGVLDIDSAKPDRFTPADLEGYILIARFLEEHHAT